MNKWKILTMVRQRYLLIPSRNIDDPGLWILIGPKAHLSVGLNGKSGDLNCILPLMITSMQK